MTPPSECFAAPAHCWRIDEALSPVSSGTCKHCGTTREFKNERRPGQLSLASDGDHGGPGRQRLPVLAFRP